MSSVSVTSVLKGAEVLAVITAKKDEGARAAAEHLLEVSRTMVPILTGALHDSSAISKVDDGEYEVFYNTSYAIAVHEDLSRHHPHGRVAKYLERPALEEAHHMFELMAARMMF